MDSINNNRIHFVFTTLAMYQTPFYLGMAKELIKQGHEASIISFHQRSHEFLKSSNVKSYDVFEFEDRFSSLNAKDTEEVFLQKIDTLSMSHANIILSHEKITFDVKNTIKLKKKFLYYLESLENYFNSIKQSEKQIIVIQETGGFTSILATYYLSKSKKYDHYFLEPSFFKGRLFTSKNSTHSPKLKPIQCNGDLPQELKSYIEKTLAAQEIVIPEKDVKQYRNPWKKVFNSYNSKRFFQKILDKYVFSKKEEFNYIFNFTLRHIKMFVNKIRFQKFYRELIDDKFIYFPFHVPMDVSLTVRSPAFVDQYSLIDYIARSIPAGNKLLIKEHPAMIGILDYSRVKTVLENNENVVLLSPKINNYNVMKKASLIITVNSKSGAEGLLLGKKVITLGDAFYSDSPLTRFCDDFQDLPEIIDSTLSSNLNSDSNQRDIYFNTVWENSFEGELYKDTPENYQKTTESLLAHIMP